MFEKIISLGNLFDAWMEFKKEKANKKDVTEFEINLEDHIFKLRDDLKSGIYKHGGYLSFFVNDPKRRHIHKASVRDRLLHHAIHRIIEPEWNKTFIFDSWSSRRGKGTHGAIKRLKKLGCKLSQNHTKTLWVLKLDIRKFFVSVDHKILLEIIKKRILNARLLLLLQEIIESFSNGLPLGNLTSQLFSNIYLDKLDQFVKHELKIVGYVRYADDFILIHPDKFLLISYLEKVRTFLWERLHLDIHSKKIILKTYASGIDYLGYICFPYYRILRTKTKRRVFARVNENNLTSYRGLLKHCRSRKLNLQLISTALTRTPSL